MPKILQDRGRKSRAIDHVNQRHRHAQQIEAATWRQSAVLGPLQIDGQGDRNGARGFGLEDAHTARLDQTAQGIRRIGDQALALWTLPQVKASPIIRHKAGTKTHELQRKTGLPAPGRAEDQHGAILYRYATGMQHHCVTAVLP